MRTYEALLHADFYLMASVYTDPRWGRIEETPGEDPYVNGEYAYEFTKGFQEGYDEGVYSGPYIKVSAFEPSLEHDALLL